MLKSFFNESEKSKILAAIQQAESNTSGEIRVHVENHCKGDLMDRAASVFALLNMHKTALRNGVLFYLAVKDKKFAILGDAGINKVVPTDFWEQIKLQMKADFSIHQFADGLSKGIILAGEQLQKNFPYQSDDVNELSDDISFKDN
ncbi:MAG: hypothetical protein RL308_2959 [Bacteroidota bacterium]|jgi:uncharacterized membrane protein